MKTVNSRRSTTYDPTCNNIFPISRSKLELFIECPRCFYLDRRIGIRRPDGPAFSLNLAVDSLLKKEFDIYRARSERHPIMAQYGVDALPFQHPDLERWRTNIKGVRAAHPESGLELFGAVDDIWISKTGDLHVVDYKATSTDREITLDGDYRDAYKRQMEIYQWLLRKEGFHVSDTGYFLFVNGVKSSGRFDHALTFTSSILPYRGDASWVKDALMEAKICLDRDTPPMANAECAWCIYRASALETDRQKNPLQDI